jgi:hypothetical protein
LVGVLVLLIGCGPNLSSPEKAGNAFVLAVNSGDLNKLKKVIGEKSVDEAVQECMDRKAKPAPSLALKGDGFDGMRRSFFAVDKARFEQDCSTIPGELNDFLALVSKSSGIRAVEVEPPKTEDGVTSAIAFIVAPNGSRDRSELQIIKSKSGDWIPSTGEGLKLANIVYALPTLGSWYAEQKLNEAFKSKK